MRLLPEYIGLSVKSWLNPGPATVAFPVVCDGRSQAVEELAAVENQSVTCFIPRKPPGAGIQAPWEEATTQLVLVHQMASRSR